MFLLHYSYSAYKKAVLQGQYDFFCKVKEYESEAIFRRIKFLHAKLSQSSVYVRLQTLDF